MATSSLADGAVQLREAQELLERVWAQSESGWRDVVRERFEEERLEPLRKQLAQVHQVIQQFGDVLNTARRSVVDADRQD